MSASRVDGKLPLREDEQEDANTQRRRTAMRIPKNPNCRRGTWEKLILPIPDHDRESGTQSEGLYVEKATAEAKTGRATMAVPKNLRPDLLQRPMSVPEFCFHCYCSRAALLEGLG